MYVSFDNMTREEAIAYEAVENACKRLKEVDRLDFAVAAIADYDNGLTQGFKDGAEWMYQKLLNGSVEWLKSHADFYNNDFTGTLDVDQLVEDYKIAMKA